MFKRLGSKSFGESVCRRNEAKSMGKNDRVNTTGGSGNTGGKRTTTEKEGEKRKRQRRMH